MTTRAFALLALLLGSMACGSSGTTPLGDTSNGERPPAGSGDSGQGGASGAGQAGTGSSGQPQGGAGGAIGPVAPRGASVAVSRQNTCARLADGSLRCWGENVYGQLGLGDTKRRGDQPGEMGAALPAVDLGAGAKVLATSVSESHTCALLAGGLVKCWSWAFGVYHEVKDENLIGEEPGEMGDALPAFSLGVEASALVATDFRGYALTPQGQMVTWTIDLLSPTVNPVPVSPAPGTSVVSVTKEGNVLFADGTFGLAEMYSDDYQLEYLPVVDLGKGIKATSADGDLAYGCAVVNGGRVKCWGSNLYGQLGLGDLVDRDQPSQLGDALPFVDLGTGVVATRVVSANHHSCAIVNEGRLKCWGEGSGGLLGYGDAKTRGGYPHEMGDDLPFVDLGTGVRVVDLVTSGEHSCAVLSDGRLKCWGANSYGQLGLGDTKRRGADPGTMGDALPFVDLGGLIAL